MSASGPIRKQDLARRGVNAITQALQGYADRSVFRGFSVRQNRGHVEYRFTWLTPHPMTVTYDSKTQSLTFRNVFPGVSSKSPLLADVRALVGERTGKGFPAHRRIDGRRVQVSLASHRGGASLILSIYGQHHQYAVKKSLDLVNELFVMLHATHAEYLIETFGLSAE
jgi:hypothetical protein